MFKRLNTFFIIKTIIITEQDKLQVAKRKKFKFMIEN